MLLPLGLLYNAPNSFPSDEYVVMSKLLAALPLSFLFCYFYRNSDIIYIGNSLGGKGERIKVYMGRWGQRNRKKKETGVHWQTYVPPLLHVPPYYN